MGNGKDSDVSLVGVEETIPQDDAGTKEGADSSSAPMKSESPQCTGQDAANINGGSTGTRPARWSTVKHSMRTCIRATGASLVCTFVSVLSDPACPALSDLVDANVRLILS